MDLTHTIKYKSSRSSESSHSSGHIDWVFYTFWVTYFGIVFGAGLFFIVETF